MQHIGNIFWNHWKKRNAEEDIIACGFLTVRLSPSVTFCFWFLLGSPSILLIIIRNNNYCLLILVYRGTSVKESSCISAPPSLTATHTQTPIHAGIHPHIPCCCDKHMHSSHCPCSRTYIKTTVWTSKIKLHLPVWDTLITPMSVGIQSKSKLCPTKTAPLISSPIKSISCPRAYFRQFISPVVSSNRPYPGLPSQKAWCDVCLSGVLYRSLMLLSAPWPFPVIIQALPLAFPIFAAGSTFCVHPEQN